MSKIIKPIRFRAPGLCENCSEPTLILLEKFVTETKLNDDGTYNTVKINNHNGIVHCTNCKSNFEYIRRGLQIIPMLVIKRHIDELVKELEYKIKNPFE